MRKSETPEARMRDAISGQISSWRRVYSARRPGRSFSLKAMRFMGELSFGTSDAVIIQFGREHHGLSCAQAKFSPPHRDASDACG